MTNILGRPDRIRPIWQFSVRGVALETVRWNGLDPGDVAAAYGLAPAALPDYREHALPGLPSDLYRHEGYGER